MKIIELTNNKNINDFNNYFEKNNETDKLHIVAFLANWCGFCEQFKPEWQKFKNMAKNKLINGIVATASDKSMGSLKCNNQINGFPTIRIFKNGNYLDYNGQRDSKHLTDYLKNLESKSSMPYFKSCKKKTMRYKNHPKIKIKISQKKIPINADIVDLSDKSENFNNSENSSKSEVDTLQTDEEKLKAAKKNIQNHIILKLKQLSKKTKRSLTEKRLKDQLTKINEDETTEESEIQEQKRKTKKRKRKKKKKRGRRTKKKKRGRRTKKKKRGKRKKKKRTKEQRIERKRSKKKSKGKGFKEWSQFKDD